jgi:hypothetical protein
MNGDSGRLLADIYVSPRYAVANNTYLRFVQCKAYQMSHEFPGNLATGKMGSGNWNSGDVG